MRTFKIAFAVYIVLITFTLSAQVDTCSNRITSLYNNDEDSWPMRAANGNYYVAYFSDSSSVPAIWMTRSTDGGITFDSTWLAIQTVDSCYYPCLAQSSDNMYHMTFFRIGPIGVDCWYSRSSDLITWTAPLNISNSVAVDWLPNLLIDVNDDLWVTFASDRSGNMDLFSTKSSDGGTTWSSPVIWTTHAYQDNLPVLFQKSDSTFVLTWQRYNDGPYNYLSATNEIWYKTSPDGITWSAEDSITFDTGTPFTDILPGVYQDPLNNEVYFTWTSNRFSPFGNNIELSLSDIQSGAMGGAATVITCTGYYARVIPADTAGQFLLTWVADPNADGEHDIYLRFLDKNNSTASLTEADNELRFTLYPNPMTTESTLQFENPANEEFQFSLYTIMGERIRSGRVRSGITIQRQGLASGIYLMELKNGKRIARGRLIIR